MIGITLDHVSLFLVTFVALPFLSYRALVAEKAKRYGKFIHIIAMGVYLERLAYLRVATNGGQLGFYDSDALAFTKELGSPVVFMVITGVFVASLLYMVLDEDRWLTANYIRKPKIIKLQKIDSSLKDVKEKSNKESNIILSTLLAVTFITYSILSLQGVI